MIIQALSLLQVNSVIFYVIFKSASSKISLKLFVCSAIVQTPTRTVQSFTVTYSFYICKSLFHLGSGMEEGSLKITCGDTEYFKTHYGVT